MQGVSGDSGPGVSGSDTPSLGLKKATGTGPGVVGVTYNLNNPSPAVQAQSGGTGAAVVATTTSIATSPAVQSTSGSTQPAVQATGIAVAAGGAVAVAGNGPALAVQGVATFTRSGVVSLTTAGTSVVVTVPGGLKTTSHVLATLQTDTGAATLAIHAAVPNTSTGKITLYFTGSAPVSTKVAWFVFG